MNFDWINLSNPVALWWIFLVSASIVNIFAWSWTRVYKYPHSRIKKFNPLKFTTDNLIWFSAGYVFGCAYRSFFVKADVQRICVFDTWFSSVFLGRSIATIAELFFVIQWSIVLYELGKVVNDDTIKKISKIIVPLIIIAECFSWFAVITTNYIGNTIEESTWTITYSLILVALFKLRKYFKDALKYAINIAIFFDFIYVLFMIFVDVHMYVTRLISDFKTQKVHLGFVEGIIDLNTRWVVTHSISDWATEIPWMSLYFSFAVLVSIGLCYIPLYKNKLQKYLR